MSFIKVYLALVTVVHVEAHDTANQYGYTQEQQAITEVACRIFYHADSRRAEEAAEVTNGVDNGDTRCSSCAGEELGRNRPEQRCAGENAGCADAQADHRCHRAFNKHCGNQRNRCHQYGYVQMPFAFLMFLRAPSEDVYRNQCAQERQGSDEADFCRAHVGPLFEHLRNPHVDTVRAFTDYQEIGYTQEQYGRNAIVFSMIFSYHN